jgi:fibronectin-binding autotransporter adhesin
VGGSASATLGGLTLGGTGDSFALTGGAGGAGTTEPSQDIYGSNANGAAGGAATLNTVQGVTLSGSSDNFSVAGGTGGNGGGYIVNGNNGGAGGAGGTASVTLNSVNLSGTGNSFSVVGGNGGVGGPAYDLSGNGGNGGSASVSVTNLALSGSGDSFTVAGGNGGNRGGYVYDPGGPGSGAGASLGVSQLSLSSGTTLSVMGGTGASMGSASLTIMSLNGSGTVTLNGSSTSLQVGTGNFSGIIAGSEVLNVAAGSGALTLSGANSFTGGTQLNSGGLFMTGTGSLGTGGLGMNSGTVFDFSGETQGVTLSFLSGAGNVSMGGNSLTVGLDNSSQSFSGTFSDGGSSGGTGASLTKVGGGDYTFSNNVSIGGGITGDNGSLVLSGSATLGGSVTGNGGDLTFSANDRIGGGTSVSGGNVNFSGNDSFGGGTTVSGGNVNFTGNNSFGAGATVSGGNLVFSGDNSFNGSMNVNGGQLQLLGTNTYSGGTTVMNGNLFAGSVSSMGATTTSLVLDDATFLFWNGFDLSRSVSLAGSAVTFYTYGNADSISATLTGTTEVMVNGGGALTLTAANSYTATTDIENASLYLTGKGTVGTESLTNNGNFDISGETQSVTLASLTGGGSAYLGANELVLGGDNSNFEFDGSLNDGGTAGGTGGSLTKVGNGLLTLTNGSNNYTGGTSILSGGIFLEGGSLGTGSLAMSAGTSFDMSGTYSPVGVGSLSGAGSVFLGGSSLYVGDNNASTTFTGVLSNGGLAGGTGGALVKQGTGTMTLTGANSYSGGTYLTAGNLVLSGTGNIGIGALSLHSGTTFDMSGADNAITVASLSAAGGTVDLGRNHLTAGIDNTSNSFAGVLSDGGLAGGTGGSFTKVGTGTLIFSGDNTYSGGTSVAGGKLILTGTGTVGTGGLGLNAGTLFDISGANGAVSVGSLSGAGNVSLGGNNLYEGADNASTTVSGTISDGGFSGGSGASLTKTGTGTLTLMGLDAYTGGTLLLEGGLAAGTSIALGSGPVNVEGGTLMTNGTFHLINVANNYTQGAQGALSLGFGGYNSGQYDQLVVNGIATIKGTLDAFSYGDFQPQWGSEFVALSAIDLVGRFSQIQSSIPGVRLYAIYDPNAVILEAMPGSFASVGGNANQKAVGADLDGLFNNNQESNLMMSLGGLTTASAYQKALGAMSPESFTGMYQVVLSQFALQASVIGQRMDDFNAGWDGNSAGYTASRYRSQGDSPLFASTLSPGQEVGMLQSDPDGAWGGNISWTSTGFSVGSTSGAQGFQSSSGGLFTANLDKRISPNLGVGFLLGYGSSNMSLNGNGSLGETGTQLGAYGLWARNGLYVKALALGGYSSYTTQRVGFGGTASGATQGDQYGGLLGLGYDFKEKNFTFGPLASMQYSRVDIAGFTEQGSLAPLTLSSQGVDSFLGELGGRASSHFQVEGVTLTPGVRVAWEHEFAYQGGELQAGFGQGDNFTVAGPAIGRDGILLGAGVGAQLTEDLKVDLQYQGELGRTNLTSNEFGGGVGLAL